MHLGYVIIGYVKRSLHYQELLYWCSTGETVAQIPWTLEVPQESRDQSHSFKVRGHRVQQIC